MALWNVFSLKVNLLSYLSKRQVSTTDAQEQSERGLFVVIPVQTIGFYNSPVYRTLKKSSGKGLTFL